MLNTVVVALLLLIGALTSSVPAQSPGPVATFLTRVERVVDSLGVRAQRASWVQQTFITDDTEILNSEAARDLSVAVQKLVAEGRKFESMPMSVEQKRKFALLKLLLPAPAPSDPAQATKLATIGAALDAAYGKGTYCRMSTSDATHARRGNEQAMAGNPLCHDRRANARPERDPRVLPTAQGVARSPKRRETGRVVDERRT